MTAVEIRLGKCTLDRNSIGTRPFTVHLRPENDKEQSFRHHTIYRASRDRTNDSVYG